MKFNERRQAILNALEKQSHLTFKELETLLNVSPTTIRRDLAVLEEESLLSRFHGGVQKSTGIMEKSMSKKQTINVEAKKKIGEKAASLIHSGELIFIGSGSTTYNMIQYIKDTTITVVTNGIPHAEALNDRNIRTFLLCGFLKDKTRSVAGEKTIHLIESFQYDQVFVSANGISTALQILSADDYEHNIKKAAITSGKTAYVMVDSQKFDKTAMYSLPLDKEKMYILTEQYEKACDTENIILCR